MSEIVRVNVMGTTYSVERKTVKEDPALKEFAGRCDTTSKKIVVESDYSDADCPFENPEEYIKRTIRHELLHAFMDESGLTRAGTNAWAHDEGCLEWISMQFPKLLAAFQEVGAI